MMKKTQRLAEIAHTFHSHFSGLGYQFREPEPLVPKADPTILFNNSAIVTIKGIMRGETLAPPGIYTIQPCLRLQGLQDDDPSGGVEYMSYFHMLGSFGPPERYRDLIEHVIGFFERIGLSKDRWRIHGSKRHVSLVQPWIQTGGVSVLLDSQPADYYDWKFGVDQVSGAGLTFSVRHSKDSGRFRDIGNLIEVRRDEDPIAYGLGVGLETMTSRLDDRPMPIGSARISDIIPDATGARARYADLLQTAVVLYHIGQRPGKGGRRHLTRRVLVALARSIDFLRVPYVQCRREMEAFELAEFHTSCGCCTELIVVLKQIS